MNALKEMKEKAHARQVLGISHNASKKEISKAYEELARKYHPDKSASNQERATEEFKEIKHAYDIMIEATTEDEPPESRNAEQSATSASSAEDWRQPEQSATSASNAADWLLPDSIKVAQHGLYLSDCHFYNFGVQLSDNAEEHTVLIIDAGSRRIHPEKQWPKSEITQEVMHKF